MASIIEWVDVLLCLFFSFSYYLFISSMPVFNYIFPHFSDKVSQFKPFFFTFDPHPSIFLKNIYKKKCYYHKVIIHKDVFSKLLLLKIFLTVLVAV